jgi:hypothetical protein
MARTRSIKPGFFDNETLGDLPPLTRLLFIGLWCIADREGRLEDKPRRIKKILLGYDDIDAEGTDSMLQSLHDSGFICRYSMGEERYIEVVNFTKHQNPHVKEKASVIPPPQDLYTTNETVYGGANQQNTRQAPDKHQTSTIQATPITFNRLPSTGSLSPTTPDGEDGGETEQENNQLGESLTVQTAGMAAGKGTREQPSKTLAERRFDEFWTAYPKKVGKKAAWSAWNKIKPDTELYDKIMTAIGRARATDQWQRENGRFIPNPATWLNQGRWDDEYEEGATNGINSKHHEGHSGQQSAATQGIERKQDALAGFKRA